MKVKYMHANLLMRKITNIIPELERELLKLRKMRMKRVEF